MAHPHERRPGLIGVLLDLSAHSTNQGGEGKWRSGPTWSVTSPQQYLRSSYSSVLSNDNKSKGWEEPNSHEGMDHIPPPNSSLTSKIQFTKNKTQRGIWNLEFNYFEFILLLLYKYKGCLVISVKEIIFSPELINSC